MDTRVIDKNRKSTHLDLDTDQRYTEKNVKITVDIKGEEIQKEPRSVHTIVDEENRNNNRVIYEDSFIIEQKQKTTEDEEESFDEWTEVIFILLHFFLAIFKSNKIF